MTHCPVYLYKKVRVSIYLDQLSLNSNENRKNVYVVQSHRIPRLQRGKVWKLHLRLTDIAPRVHFFSFIETRSDHIHYYSYNTPSIPPTQRYEINQGLVLLVGPFDLASFVLITNQMYFDLRCSVILEITWGLVLNWVLVPFCPYPFLQTLSISINWLIWLPVTNRPAQLHFRWLFNFVPVDKMG